MLSRILHLYSTTLMSLVSLKNGVIDDTVFAPKGFSGRQITDQQHADNFSQNHLPSPSFFSNFQMPFHSFEEEVIIRDRETEESNFSNPFYIGRNEPAEDGDGNSLDAPMVLSDFGNVSMEVGATQFFDKLEEMALERAMQNQSQIFEEKSQNHTNFTLSQPEFSVYRITTDGHTPFDQESESEILYGDDGFPDEVVVYLQGSSDGGDGATMETSESQISSRKSVGKGGKMGGSFSSSYSHLPLPSTYVEEMEYDEGPFGISRSDVVGGRGGEYVDDDDSGEDIGAIRRSGHGHSGYGGGGHGHSGYGGGGYDDHHGGGYDHHGGYDDHHGYGDDHDAGYSPVKKPGKFGKGKPNFKCEYAKETLYVSKTTYKFFKKCYYIFKVKCKKKDGKGKKIGYKKLCNEFSITKCRKVFATKFKTKCWLVYKKKCENIYKTKIDWIYKESCKTVYEKECSGYGYHKHCHEVPKEICNQVPVKKEKQIKSIKCRKVPDKKCKDVPFFVPKKECKDFPKTVCTNDPINIKKGIPLKACFPVPITKCVKIPKEVVRNVPRTVKKKVCVSTKAKHDSYGGGPEEIHVHGGYGHDDHGGYGHDDHHGGGGYGHGGGLGGGYGGHGGHSGHGGHGHGGGGYHRSDDAGDIIYEPVMDSPKEDNVYVEDGDGDVKDRYDIVDHINSFADTYEGTYFDESDLDDYGNVDTGGGGGGVGDKGSVVFLSRNTNRGKTHHKSHVPLPAPVGGGVAYLPKVYGGYESSVHYHRAPAESDHKVGSGERGENEDENVSDNVSKLLVQDAVADNDESTKLENHARYPRRGNFYIEGMDFRF